MMNEIGLFKAVPSTILTPEYVYERLNACKLSHRPGGYYGSSAVDYTDYPFSQAGNGRDSQ